MSDRAGRQYLARRRSCFTRSTGTSSFTIVSWHLCPAARPTFTSWRLTMLSPNGDSWWALLRSIKRNTMHRTLSEACLACQIPGTPHTDLVTQTSQYQEYSNELYIKKKKYIVYCRFNRVGKKRDCNIL